VTWVVGRTVMVGYALGLSDIRVTLSDGSERDCVRKIYPVGRMIALGFAGSVAIGFAMVDRLAALLRDAAPGMGWDPAAVAEWWPADAREVFERCPQAEQELSCHLMMLGTHPNQDNGPFAQSYVYRFTSPDFHAERAQAEQVVSIGSGAAISRYVAAIAELSDNYDLLRLEAAGPRGVALGTMSSLTRLIEDHPTAGISQHLHVCVVHRDRIELGPNDQRYFAHPERDLVMPPVANSLAELTELLTKAGLSSAGARC
jgi:hypothetical protein